MGAVKSFLKKEPVLAVSGALAVLSAFFVPPSAAYLSYIDFRTLGILFCLMAAVAGLSGAGVFDALARLLSRKAGTVRRLVLLLTLAAFGLSMFITNDVALITFVPLTILMLGRTGQRTLISAVVMETIGANLGSALTPFGNPQNLYLYSRYGMGIGEFLGVTGPLCLMGLLLTAGGVLLCRLPREPIAPPAGEAVFCRRKALFYGALFLISLLAVFRALPWPAALVIAAAALALTDRGIFRRLDYSLLLTFVFFFILVGNLGSIPSVERWISGLLEGRPGEPGHQQRPGGADAVGLYGQLAGAAGRDQYRRTGHPDCLHGEPYFLPAVRQKRGGESREILCGVYFLEFCRPAGDAGGGPAAVAALNPFYIEKESPYEQHLARYESAADSSRRFYRGH